MKCLVIFVLFSIAIGSAFCNVSEELGVYDYHNRIGIPVFQQIKNYEEGLLKNSSRTVGGGTTLITTVPYQAGLIVYLSLLRTSVCGGALIADNTVLTAAHCYNDGNSIANSITVVLGSQLLSAGGTRVEVISIAMHPGYNPLIVSNDIAVLRIPPVSFSLFISPIVLPSGSELNQNFVGNWALASGFGITSDGASVSLFQTINSVDLQVISNSECSSVYGSVIQDHHLCTSGAGSVGTCDGDNGGPLAANLNGRRVLIGISSFRSAAGCQSGLPSAFSRVTDFVQWIWSV